MAPTAELYVPAVQAVGVETLAAHQLPAGHCVDTAPPGQNCPAMHAAHAPAADWPVFGFQVPAAQTIREFPPLQKWPASQVVQVPLVDAPVAVEYDPAGQSTFALPPAQYDPDGQVAQVLIEVAPREVDQVPGKQAVGEETPEAHQEPTGHCVTTLLPGQKLPMGHAGHVCVPSQLASS